MIRITNDIHYVWEVIKIIGLEYILNSFESNANQLSQELGISRFTIYDWIKERRPIPKKRLPELAEHFNLDEDLFQKELSEEEMKEIDLIAIRSNNDKVIEVIEATMKHPEKRISAEDMHNLIISLYRKMVLEEESHDELIRKVDLTRIFLDLMIEDKHRNALWEVFDLLSQDIEEFKADLFKVVQKYEGYL